MLVRGFARENAQGKVEIAVPLFSFSSVETKDRRSLQKRAEDIFWCHLKFMMEQEVDVTVKSYNAQTGEVIFDVEAALFFAALIREHRKKQGLTYEQLSRKCKKISRGYICDIERGRVTPTPTTLEKIFKALLIAIG